MVKTNFPPGEFYAGDSAEWTVSFADYPSDQYTLRYVFHNVAYRKVVDASATPDGGYVVNIAPADTAKFPAGDYTITAFVVNDPQNPTFRQVVEQGHVTVYPDLPGLQAPLDMRSHAQKMLAAINAMLEGKATHDQQNYQIAGRSLTRYSWEELHKLRNSYRQEIRAELQAQRAAEGKPRGGKILGVFGNG